MSEIPQITDEVAAAAAQTLAEQQQAEEEAKKPKMAATIDFSHLVTKQDFSNAIQAVRDENKELKELLLKAKAQGKAHIVEEKQQQESELKKLYGDTLKFI